MTHPLIRYYQTAFARYRVPSAVGVRIAIPQLADPLMSPHFIALDDGLPAPLPDSPALSLLGPLTPDTEAALAAGGFAITSRMTVGVIPLTADRPAPVDLTEVPLTAVLGSADYRAILEHGFPGDAGFLTGMLLPFLTTCNADYRCFLLWESGELVATATAGITDGVAFIFNLTVSPSRRGTRLASAVRDSLKSTLGQRGLSHIVFWTSQPIIQRFAPEQTDYTIARSR